MSMSTLELQHEATHALYCAKHGRAMAQLMVDAQNDCYIAAIMAKADSMPFTPVDFDEQFSLQDIEFITNHAEGIVATLHHIGQL